MSTFTKEKLYALHERYMSTFAELAVLAEKENVDFQVKISTTGTISFESNDWFTTDKGKRAVRIFEIEHGKNHVEESSKTYTYGD